MKSVTAVSSMSRDRRHLGLHHVADMLWIKVVLNVSQSEQEKEQSEIAHPRPDFFCVLVCSVMNETELELPLYNCWH